MRGGVVFAVGSTRHFLPSKNVIRVLPIPRVAEIPGAPTDVAGMALVGGTLLPVVSLDTPSHGGISRRSDRSEAMLVCKHEGEHVGLIGVRVLASGDFEDEGEADVRFEGTPAYSFDLIAVFEAIRGRHWAF